MKNWVFFLWIIAGVGFAQEAISEEQSGAGRVESEIAILDGVIATPFTQTAPSFSTSDLQASQDPILPQTQKSWKTATFLSALFPGLGHYYLGDAGTANGLMGAGVAELGAVALLAERGQENGAFFSLITFANTLNYSLFAAYRDARSFNGQQGFKYPMPKDSLGDLSAAPFRWSIIKKPEVWGGCLGALALAVGVNYLERRLAPVAAKLPERIAPWFPAISLPVGIGEESLFRGFLQSQLAENLDSYWGAIVTSSLLFGAAHIPNAQMLPKEERWRYYSFSLPLITGLGVYFGWLTKQNVSLQESVAVHMWYDFTLFGLAAAAQSAAVGYPSFCWAVGF